MVAESGFWSSAPRPSRGCRPECPDETASLYEGQHEEKREEGCQRDEEDAEGGVQRDRDCEEADVDGQRGNLGLIGVGRRARREVRREDGVRPEGDPQDEEDEGERDDRGVGQPDEAYLAFSKRLQSGAFCGPFSSFGVSSRKAMPL